MVLTDFTITAADVGRALGVPDGYLVNLAMTQGPAYETPRRTNIVVALNTAHCATQDSHATTHPPSLPSPRRRSPHKPTNRKGGPKAALARKQDRRAYAALARTLAIVGPRANRPLIASHMRFRAVVAG
jgi:hypothetical protein